MNEDLHPIDGARYLLERTRELDDGIRAQYRAAIYTRDAEFTATATLEDNGRVELPPTGAPEALHARLTTIAKLVARDAGKLRADGMPPWPSRIMRWRR